MKCDEIRTLLNLYVDNELAVPDADKVEKHLGQCPVCAEEIAELKKVKELLRKLPSRPAPAGLLEGIQSNMARSLDDVLRENNAFLRYRWLTVSLASAAAIVLVVVTVVIQSRKIDMPVPAGQTGYKYSEKAQSNLGASVAAKIDIAGDDHAQPMLFTQQINISALDVNNAVAKVYAAASARTLNQRLRAEYQERQAIQEDLLARAPAEKPVQDENPTVTNSVAPLRLRESKIQSPRQLSQTVKISIPLAQKDAFIRQLRENIPDKIVLSEMQAFSQDKMISGYRTDAGLAMTESEKQQDRNEVFDKDKLNYDTIFKGGEGQAGSKKSEANKKEEYKPKGKNIVTTGADKGVEETAKLKSAEEPKPVPGAIATTPPSPSSATPPPPPSPPSPPPPSPATQPPVLPAKGVRKAPTGGREDVHREKNLEKKRDAKDAKADISQIVQDEPQPMIEFIIVIDPVAAEAK